MLPILRHCFTRRIFNTLLFELLILNICFTVLILSRSIYWSQANHYPLLTALFALSNTLVVQVSLWSFGLYSREVVYSGHRVMPNLAGSFVFSALLLLPLCFLFSLSGVKVFEFTLRFYLLSLLAFTSLIALERSLVLRIFNESPYLGNVLVLGANAASRELVAEARRHHGRTFHLVGVLAEDHREEREPLSGFPVIGSLADLQQVVRRQAIEVILVALPLHSPLLPTDFLLKCKMNGVVVLDAAHFYERLAKKVLLERLEPIQLLFSESLFMTRFRWSLKAMGEKALAVVLLASASPLLGLVALLIKLTSPGPVLYRQDRVGKDGLVFKLLKFRSMVQGAEPEGEAVWAREGDPRVTPLGRVLRKFRLDELPQLFNVLRGEMAIVGPRPERPEFVQQLREAIPFYNERHLVLPGITGWAQVAYPYGSSFEDAREKLRYDLYYIKHMSLFFDLVIIISTVRTVLFGKGAR